MGSNLPRIVGAHLVEFPLLRTSSRHGGSQNEIFEQSEVWCSQACDRVPTVYSLETLCTTSGVIAAGDVVQTLVPLGVQPRVQEPERGKSCGDAGVIEERDHSGESLSSGISISESRLRLHRVDTYGCAGTGASDGIELASYDDLEVQSLGSNVWESPTRATIGSIRQHDGLDIYHSVKPT